MALTDIAAAIRSRFGTTVEDVQQVPVVYDNQEDADGEPPTDGLWIHLSVVFDTTRKANVAGAGSGIYRTEGRAVADLMKPAGEGEGDLLDLADAIVEAFRGVGIASPAISFYAPSIGDGFRDKGFWTRSVEIPFRTDEYQ